jgi:hypothetical protein
MCARNTDYLALAWLKNLFPCITEWPSNLNISPNSNIRGPGACFWWKKRKSKISCKCTFKLRLYTYTIEKFLTPVDNTKKVR